MKAVGYPSEHSTNIIAVGINLCAGSVFRTRSCFMSVIFDAPQWRGNQFLRG